MDQVLFVSGNTIECRVVKEQLDDVVSVLVAQNQKEMLKVLGDEDIKLCILDIPGFDQYGCGLINEIKRHSPDLPILVLSTGSHEENMGYAWRMGVQDYLLKPCRRSWLLAAVKAMVKKNKPKPEVSPDKPSYSKQHYKEQLGEAVRSLEYKKCIILAKEYIDFIHNKADNLSMIRAESVDFVASILELGLPMAESVQHRLNGYFKAYEKRFDQQGSKYDTLVVVEKMVGAIIDDIGQSQYYGSYDLDQKQRILNYVDQNIKQSLSLNQIAEYANMSSCYFSKFFKKIAGCTYVAYITDAKIEYAKYMLRETELPVVNIARELAYRETNYFSKTFKKIVGISPTEYREQESRSA